MWTAFRDWGIKTKIMTILITCIAIIALAVEIILSPLMLRHFMNERQEATRNLVEVACSIVDKYAKKVSLGQMPLAEAQSEALSLIRSLRFAGNEYFWVHDTLQPIPRMIMHPTVPSLNGKILDDIQFNRATSKRCLSDKNSVPLNNANLFVTMNELVESHGEGFVTYVWPKPISGGGITKELYPKVSFVKKYTPWKWIIGSGIYVDDVKTTVSNFRWLIHISSILFCLTAVFIYFLMMRYISKPIINLAQLATKIAGGEYGAQLPVVAHDEVGMLNETINAMSNEVLAKTRDLGVANLELKYELDERLKAEESLRVSESKFRTLVENSFDVIFVLDEFGCFQFVSPSWHLHFGFPADVVIGQKITSFVHPDDIENCSSYLNNVMESGMPAACLPYRVRHQNGTWRFFVTNGTMHIDSDGNKLYIGIGRDITDERRLEEERMNLERQFLQAQKLESLGLMASGIAHDFNNLLAVIIGNLELSMVKGNSAGINMSNIEKAMQASKSAADITQKMLAYTGKGIIERKPININSFVTKNIDLFRTVVPRTIAFDTDLSDISPMVFADSGQLQQVIMNLITNAAEAIGSSPGNIKISTGVEDFDERILSKNKLDNDPPPGTFSYFEITDSGCGMDSETQLRIFEPFYTTKFTGRGLGMSSVMGIIKAHNGAILLYSEPDFGSTFKILLPFYSGECITDTQLTEASLQYDAPITALVVDDEELVREVCCEYLDSLGIKVIDADDGFSAIEKYKQHADEVTFVMLDLTMPKMDGIATFKELRRINPNVKVIISSGHATEVVAKLFSGEMPDGFIQKPFQLDNLLNKINESCVLGICR